MNTHLLQILAGDRCLSEADILASLHQRGQLLPLLRGVAVEALIEDAAQKAGLAVSDEELQSASEGMRRTLGLQSANSTHKWLNEERLSVEQFERRIKLDVLIEKFKEHLLTRYGLQYLTATPERWSQVRLRRLTLASLNEAREIYVQIQEEGVDFAELAEKHSIDTQTRQTRGDIGVVLRHQLRPEVRDLIFDAKAGSVSKPVHGPDGFEIYFIEEFVAPVFDKTTRNAIREELLRNFISRMLSDVKIMSPLFNRSDTKTDAAHAESGTFASISHS